MQISKRQALDKAAAFLKKLIGLAGKANHDVCADCSFRHGFMDLSDLLRIMPWAILAMHAAQNTVATGLQRNMRVLSDARRARDQGDQVVAPVHRFDGADAYLLNVCVLEQFTDKLLEVLLRLEVAAPTAQIDAAEHNLAIPRCHQRIGFFYDTIELHRAALPADTGNNAERTAVVTS